MMQFVPPLSKYSTYTKVYVDTSGAKRYPFPAVVVT